MEISEFENLFDSESDDNEELIGFTVDEVEQIQKAFDEGDVEDHLEGEDLSLCSTIISGITWDYDEACKVEVPKFCETVGPTKQLPQDATLLD